MQSLKIPHHMATQEWFKGVFETKILKLNETKHEVLFRLTQESSTTRSVIYCDARTIKKKYKKQKNELPIAIIVSPYHHNANSKAKPLQLGTSVHWHIN